MLPLIVVAFGGAVVGVVSGYAFDRAFGDGEYTTGEMVSDAVMGGLGFGVLKAGSKMVGGLRYAATARKAESAEDVARIMNTGFAASTRGAAENAIIAGGDYLIQKALDPGTIDKPSFASKVAGTAAAVYVLTHDPPKRGGSKGKNVKTWCRRHNRYASCQ